jgi:hypothetical protein
MVHYFPQHGGMHYGPGSSWLLRSLTYTKTGGVRKLHTPDAIHLASAPALVESYGIGELEAFHTFDGGKSRGIDGPGTPLLGFETWYESLRR